MVTNKKCPKADTALFPILNLDMAESQLSTHFALVKPLLVRPVKALRDTHKKKPTHVRGF